MEERLYRRIGNISVDGELAPIADTGVRNELQDRCLDLIYFKDSLSPTDIHRTVGDLTLLTGYTERRTPHVVLRNSPEVTHPDTQVVYRLSQFASSHGLFRSTIEAYTLSGNNTDPESIETWAEIELDDDSEPNINRLYYPRDDDLLSRVRCPATRTQLFPGQGRPTRLAKAAVSDHEVQMVFEDVVQAFSLNGFLK